MRRRPLLVRALAAAASAAALLGVACGSAYDVKNQLPVDDDPRLDGGTTARADAKVPPRSDADVPPGVATAGRVLAHTGQQLYRLEPETRKLTLLGSFDCLEQGDSVIDLAVDRTGAVYATSFRGFLTIDPLTASCSFLTKAADYPNSLSFMPVGTVDATTEALVGYAFDGPYAVRYVRIDTETGAMTDLGRLNPPNAVTEYISSGDLVGLINAGNRAYLTVRFKGTPDSGTTTDRLAEIDPATGVLLRILGDTKQRNLFGLGYWAGKGYGFADDGTVAEIDMKTGVGVPLQLSGVTQKQKWYGAGVSTQAPVQ